MSYFFSKSGLFSKISRFFLSKILVLLWHSDLIYCELSFFYKFSTSERSYNCKKQPKLYDLSEVKNLIYDRLSYSAKVELALKKIRYLFYEKGEKDSHFSL